MQISDIMTTNVYTCRPEDTLRDAASIMRVHDCGAVPVVDGREELVGILTDRDICLCGSDRDEPLHAVQISNAVTWKPVTCHPDEEVDAAESKLRQHQIRRLPIIDPRGFLVGILSLGDIARARANGDSSMEDHTELAKTIAAISWPPPPAGHGSEIPDPAYDAEHLR